MSENPKLARPEAPLQISIESVAQFIRQLSHDLRNHLNAAELQSAFINEIAADAELKDEVKRLRAMLSEMGSSLQRLTFSLGPVQLNQMGYEASCFMEDLEQKIASSFREKSEGIEWAAKVGEAMLRIDPQVLPQALVELFTNALQHDRGDGPLRAEAVVEENEFVFTLREPKAAFQGSTENWGREPFQKLKHGHYALGLYRARNIIEAHSGRYDARYDSASSSLVTTVRLPLDRQK